MLYIIVVEDEFFFYLNGRYLNSVFLFVSNINNIVM